VSGEELRKALVSVRVHSATDFELLGRRHRGVDLAETLYATLHCRVPSRGSPDAGFTNWTGARAFADRLSAANAGTGTWQGGWAACAVEDDGRIVAERHGVRFRMAADEYRSGAARIPKDHFELIPGFYLAHGDADDTRDTDRTIRIYWHVAPAGAELLVRSATGLLNHAGIGFQLKVLSEPLRYQRTDPAVLYLARESYGPAAPLLARIHRELRPWLRSSVSRLVKRIAAGVGLAEDPGDGSSFGEHRSRLLAAVIGGEEWTACDTDDERAALLSSRLGEQGYDLERIHLNPGSADDLAPIAGAAP
jgi:hypothetical protein